MSSIEYIPVSHFSTEDIDPQDRLEAWRSRLGGAYAITADRKEFHASVKSVMVDRVAIRVLDASPQSVERTALQIRRDSLEHANLHLTMHGYEFAWPGGQNVANPGDVTISDLTRPFQRSMASERGSIVVSLPRELVEAATPRWRSWHGTVMAGAANGLFVEHMRMLGNRIDQLPQASAAQLAQATVWMLAAAVAGDRDSIMRAGPAIDAARIVQATRYIRANLHRLDLTPETLAAALQVSRSKLFTLFEAYGGVERYILNHRLASVADALRDPRETRPIATLGFAYGFASASHFSRAFRARYGLTPREMREAGRNFPADTGMVQETLFGWLDQIE